MSCYISKCEDCGKNFLYTKMIVVKYLRFCETCREKEEHVGSNVVLWTDQEASGIQSPK